MSRAALLALASLALAGCYESHDSTSVPPPPGSPDAGPDATRPPPPPPPPPGTNTYVIAQLRAPAADFGGTTVGANLDGMDSGMGSGALDATCEELQADFVSRYDGTRGVDNAYGTLVPTLDGLLGETTVDEELRAAIESGELLLLMQLIGTPVNQVIIELGAASGGLRTEADGSLSPNQSFFAIETIGVGMASQSGDRVTVALGTLRAPLVPSLLPVLPFGELDRAEMRFDVTSTGLTNGELAGAIDVETWVLALGGIMPGIEDTIRSVLQSVADISPSVSEPQVCDQLSLGLDFRAVPALRSDL